MFVNSCICGLVTFKRMYQVIFLLFAVSLVPVVESSAYCQFEQTNNGRCKEIYQMNCPKKCFNPQECPEGKCFDVYAKKFHDHHVHDRGSGCPTCCCCEWRDCPCGVNRCKLDEEGCPTTKCLEPEHHQCPKKRFCPRDCNTGNQGGYRIDDWGCPTCDCSNTFEKQLYDRVYGEGKNYKVGSRWN